MNLKTYLIGGCVVFALGLVSCEATSDVLDRSQAFADRRNFHQAYWVVAQALDEFPDDERLERVFWERRLDYLLDLGQQLVFQEQEQRAIGEFQKALALDPENRRAKLGIERARAKLAVAALHHAERQLHEGDLEGALKLYNKTLSYAPELKAAIEGIETVNKFYQSRSEKSGEHYTLGSRARGEQRFRESYYHSGVATDFDKSNQRAGQLHTVTGKRLAEELFDKAKEMESKSYYAAALQDYRQVLLAMPDTPGLGERIEAMELEVEVRDLYREAEMLTRKKEFDDADKKLAEAFAKTELEKALVSGLMLDAKVHRYQEVYVNAKDLELEHRFEAALEVFRSVEEAFPNRGFLDVKTRISWLTSYIDEATKSWEAGKAAEKAGKIKEAVDHYEEAVLIYPGFHDLDRHIKELRSRIDT